MSKKIIFFAILTTGLFFSCQKSNIQPQTNLSNTDNIPAWRGAVSSSNNEFADPTGLNDRTEDVKKDTGITDPNNDEDRNKKKKGNN